MPEHPRRRASDGVDPDIMLAISDQAAENRHLLRGELTAAILELRGAIHDVGQKVEIGNLADVTERAKMTSTLEALVGDVKEIRTELADVRGEHQEFKRDIERRVRSVEDAQMTATAADVAAIGLRKTFWWGVATVCTVLIGAAGVIVALIH